MENAAHKKEQILAALAERIESSQAEHRFEALQLAFQLFSELSGDLADAGEQARLFGEQLGAKERGFFSDPQGEDHRVAQDAYGRRKEYLVGLPALKGASDWTLSLVASLAEEIQLSPGEDFLSEYRPVPALYLVKAPVKAHRQNLNLPLETSGGLFGEQACLKGELQSLWSLQVTEVCEALLVPSDRLQAVLPWNPEFRNLVVDAVMGKLSTALAMLGEELSRSQEQLRLTQRMLDNIGQASLAIDSKGEIGPNYSKVAAEYLGREQLEGLPFADLILRGERKALRSYYRALSMIFAGNQFDPQAVLELLPKRAELNAKQFRLYYYFSEDHLGYVTSVYVRLEDVTKELEAKARQVAQAEREERDRQVAEKIRANLGAFMSLLDLIEPNDARLGDLDKTLKNNQTPDSTDLRNLMKQLHSIKGLCGQFGLNDLKNRAHQTEDGVQALARGGTGEGLRESIKSLKKGYRQARGLVDAMGPEVMRLLKGVHFERSEFDQLEVAVRSQDWEEVSRLVLSREQVPAAAVAEHWAEDLSELAAQLGKQVRFELDCPEGLTLHKDLARLLNFELRHCYRNAIDHGIETPEVRSAQGKEAAGQVRLKMTCTEGHLHLELCDDGAGIDWKKIETKALNHPHLDHTQVQGLIDQGLSWKILLLPGFTSQEQVSQVSGRGVGLDAVESSLLGLGGQMSIRSEPGQGTCFLFDLPQA